MVIVLVFDKSEEGNEGALPDTKSTAVVSPKALERAIITAVKIPLFALGITTFKIVWLFVAARA